MRLRMLRTAALSGALLAVPALAHGQSQPSGNEGAAQSSSSSEERSGQQLKRGSLRSAPARRPSEHQSKQIDNFIKDNEAQIRAATLKRC